MSTLPSCAIQCVTVRRVVFVCLARTAVLWCSLGDVCPIDRPTERLRQPTADSRSSDTCWRAAGVGAARRHAERRPARLGSHLPHPSLLLPRVTSTRRGGAGADTTMAVFTGVAPAGPPFHRLQEPLGTLCLVRDRRRIRANQRASRLRSEPTRR